MFLAHPPPYPAAGSATEMLQLHPVYLLCNRRKTLTGSPDPTRANGTNEPCTVNSDFNIFIREFNTHEDFVNMNIVLKHCKYIIRYPFVSCRFSDTTVLEISSLFNEDMKGLCLYGSYNKFCCSEKFPHNRLLEQLCLREISDEDIFVALSTAIQEKFHI